MEQNAKHRSGFIAVIGRPNVGKSTLINTLIGQKIAIMSDKPQTTQNRILCILTEPDAQIVFLDTPGIHKPKHKLGEYMVKAAEGTLKEVDAILFVVDATEKMGPGEYYILERLQATRKPVILVSTSSTSSRRSRSCRLSRAMPTSTRSSVSCRSRPRRRRISTPC